MGNIARKIAKKQWHSGKVGCWLHLRSFLVINRDYHIQGKNIRLHLKVHSDLLPLLFAFGNQNYVRYLTEHHVELTNLSFTKPQAFSDLEAFVPGDSLSGNKFSTIPGDLVTAVAINREVKARGSPMRGGYSASINAESDFILNFHMLAKLKKEFKKKNEFKNRFKPQRINAPRD